METRTVRLVARLLLVRLPVCAAAQGAPTMEQVNEANNPLTPKLTINV
jgi:hypothetical protein